jgi:hypothetical protein
MTLTGLIRVKQTVIWMEPHEEVVYPHETFVAQTLDASPQALYSDLNSFYSDPQQGVLLGNNGAGLRFQSHAEDEQFEDEDNGQDENDDDEQFEDEDNGQDENDDDD